MSFESSKDKTSPSYKYKFHRFKISPLNLSIPLLSLHIFFPFTLFFQLHVLFFSRLHGMRRHHSWLAKPMATNGVPAPTESLSGGRLSVSHQWTKRDRSDWPTWRRTKESLCVPHIRVQFAYWPKKVSTQLFFSYGQSWTSLLPMSATCYVNLWWFC